MCGEFQKKKKNGTADVLIRIDEVIFRNRQVTNSNFTHHNITVFASKVSTTKMEGCHAGLIAPRTDYFTHVYLKPAMQCCIT
jgi:hypothetical protein